MASMNYFDSSRKSLSYFFKLESLMEMCVIPKSTNLHTYSCFSYMDNLTVRILFQFNGTLILATKTSQMFTKS